MRLAILAAILSALCVGGSFVAYRAYDNATKPDRSAPDKVVNNYLQALLDRRNDAEAAQYVCADQSGLATITSYRDNVIGRAESQGASVSFDWILAVQRGGDRSNVTADLQLTAAIGSSVATSHSTWDFVVEHSADWRVCAASEALPSPSPSLSP
jgi:hypothetical protein